MTGPWDAAWARALDDLELDVVRAERVLAGAHELADEIPTFVPPELPGPIPSTLVRRARELLARQAGVVQRLSTAVDETRRQRHVTARFEAGRAPAVPIYVDSTY